MPVLPTKTCISCRQKTKKTKGWLKCNHCNLETCTKPDCCYACGHCKVATCVHCRTFVVCRWDLICLTCVKKYHWITTSVESCM